MPAPPPPSVEEWALAATYTLKNSKRYRYNWGQQVRSMMGTAVEGERQGLVRFRIKISPDGTLARADVLWSTSKLVEKLALQAIRAMPPLAFEKSIAFVVRDGLAADLQVRLPPDPSSFQNPFAWNRSSPQSTSQAHPENASPSDSATQAAEYPDAGPDSVEAEEKDIERQFNEWGRRD